ncbi:GNAT family N-acetyltransferase [Phytoactinopolyspora endophytica]|uniref:GNAT family N-acetyltransferase n=1 Tax=Phytoactinopolyspora endophytica TaxID=1642495 RepID=UPI00197BDA5A|nr:GNAT family N-acetyltransferase [Phytoactinopolyspora endophytica]
MSEQPIADKSVRTAWAADAEAIGRVQARAWMRSYHELLPKAVLNQIDATTFADAWRQAIIRPPSAQHRVLVALDHGSVVGFAATAPSGDPDAVPQDGEVVAFHIDPDAQRQGHGSRLIAAVADTLRADGFTRARLWLVVGDDQLRGFLEPAGWGPDSAHRTLDLSDDGSATLRQVRLHTDLESE